MDLMKETLRRAVSALNEKMLKINEIIWKQIGALVGDIGPLITRLCVSRSPTSFKRFFFEFF